jgi:hypothetical protein
MGKDPEELAQLISLDLSGHTVGFVLPLSIHLTSAEPTASNSSKPN